MKEYNWREERKHTANQPQQKVESTINEKQHSHKYLFFAGIALLVVILAGVSVYYNVSSKSEQVIIPSIPTNINHSLEISSVPSGIQQKDEVLPQRNSSGVTEHKQSAAQILRDAIKAQNAGDFKTAAEKYKLAADMGNAVAQYMYGLFLLEGKYVTQDFVQAEKYLKMSAGQGFEFAQVRYGVELLKGKNFTKNITVGKNLLSKALESKHTHVVNRFLAAHTFFFYELYDTTISDEEYLALHQKGRREIEICVSQKYKHALSLWEAIKDFSEAEHLYRRLGVHVKTNFPAAKLVADAAITLGHHDASFLLACFFLEDEYTKRNLSEARKYANLYLKKATAEEKYQILFLFFLNRDYEFSLPCWCGVAENGHVESQFTLFCVYYEGKNGELIYFKDLKDVPRNNAKAIYFLQMAAKNNNPIALMLLGYFHFTGELVPKNQELALKYLQKSADLGCKEAKEILEQLRDQNKTTFFEKQRNPFSKINSAINGILEKKINKNGTAPAVKDIHHIEEVINTEATLDLLQSLNAISPKLDSTPPGQKKQTLNELIENSIAKVEKNHPFSTNIILHHTQGNPSYGCILMLNNSVIFGKQMKATEIQEHPANKNLGNLHNFFQKTLSFFNNYFNWKSYDNNNGICKVYYETKKEEKYFGGITQIKDFMNAFALPLDSASDRANCRYVFAFHPALVLQDVITHEFTHAITGQRINNGQETLIYYSDSGAINESFSDIFACLQRIAINPSVQEKQRWMIGDPKIFVRNLAKPTDNMPEYYKQAGKWCDDPAFDRGGVHHNSSVLGKMAYLLCDGGSFRGQNIKAMGYMKVGKLFWQLQDIKYIDVNQQFKNLSERILRAALDAGFSDDDLLNIRNACLAINLPVDKKFMQHSATFATAATKNLFRRNIALACQDTFGNNVITSQQSFRKLFNNDEIGKIYVKGEYSVITSKNSAQAEQFLNIANMSGSFSGINKVFLTSQSLSGIPVFGTTAVVRTDKSGKIISFTKNFSSNISRMQIKRKAFPYSLKKNLFADNNISKPIDRIFDPSMFNLKGKPAVVWQIDTQTHRYLVNQETGKVVFDYPLIIVN